MTSVLLLCRCQILQASFRHLWQHKRFLAKTHYEVLGVSRKATQDEIKAAYINLSKQLHPDLNKSDPKFHEKFVRVNEAYNVLCKPSLRRDYDMTFGPQISGSPYSRTEERIFEQQFGYKPPRQSQETDSGPNQSGYDSKTGKRIFYDETILPQRPYQINRKGLMKLVLQIICFAVIVNVTFLQFYMKRYQKNKEAADARSRRILQEYEESIRFHREHPEALKEQLKSMDKTKTGKR
ncbi:hypothetical protein CHS0354_013798 [Potamilus streckersoni]|uniref:J domain-containing protein n=1 Tax=Potamilus streckersoni TaxID=2493646 RepID=A0AAE0VVL2_9BIVA|nr:hypothetical protein CHS0354_013798 [Potamilus streckersoni]